MDPTLNASPGIPGWFVAFAVIAFIGMIAGAVWKFSVAKDSAESMGVPSDKATEVALLNPDSAIAMGTVGAAAIDRLKAQGNDVTDDSRPANDRLADLEAAHAAGHVTDDEYAHIRQRILGSF